MIKEKKGSHKKADEINKKPELNFYGNIATVTGRKSGTGPDTMMGLTMGPVKP